MGAMRLLFLTTIISLLLCASAEARNLRIVVFGDSLTAGYELQPQESFAVKLENKLRETGFNNITVTDMSTAAGTTVKAAARVEEILQKRPDIVVLAYGLSDTLRGIAPSSIYSNVAYITGWLQQKRIYTVLMGVEAPGLGDAYERQLPHYYHSIAKHYELPFYPDALAGIAGEAKYTTADGYTPNAQGVDIMVEGMYRLVDYGLRWKMQVLQQEQYQ
jgi:acyl-CoA thioesterase-1